MSPLKELFRDYKILIISRVILLEDNSLHSALGFGSILLQVPIGQSLFIPNVLYVLGLTKNLLSISQIMNTRNTIITFTQTQCIIDTRSSNPTKQMKFQIPKEGTLFLLGTDTSPLDSNY